MDNDPEYQRALRRVKSIKGFYLHLSIFLLVIALLAVVNVMMGGVWWVQWPALGWGIGIMVHAVVVFGLAGWLGPDWEEQKIKEFMAKKPEP